MVARLCRAPTLGLAIALALAALTACQFAAVPPGGPSCTDGDCLDGWQCYAAACWPLDAGPACPCDDAGVRTCQGGRCLPPSSATTGTGGTTGGATSGGGTTSGRGTGGTSSGDGGCVCRICGESVCGASCDYGACSQGAGQYCDAGICVCDANSCPEGCCDGFGRCRTPSNDSAACGQGGATCVICAAGQVCFQAACCAPSCAPDGGSGSDDGCGGKCALTGNCVENNCPSGCCTPESDCVLGNDDHFCGHAGNACVDCTSTAQICDRGSDACCTPACSGTQACGADDACGSYCAAGACRDGGSCVDGYCALQ